MARGTDIWVGPWPDGINLLDKPDYIRDSQLVDCHNLDINNTGILVPRRGLRYRAQDATTQTKYLLGTIIRDGQSQPEAMTSTYDGASSFFKTIGDPTAPAVNWTNTRAGIFKSVVQYQNKIWYIPGVSTAVGASSPAAVANTLTGVAAMPYGDYGFILKDRLFIVRKSTSEIYFSKATDFTVWAAPDGGVIQINPGDNQPITKVVTVNNQVIIFKSDSTYVLSFTANPTADGVVRQVSADQGALDAITYNNEVYCYNSRSVFKFVNGFFQDIGLQLNLPNLNIDGTSASAKINVVGKTLILGSFNTTSYAMNLDTGAWTRYTLPGELSINTGTVYSRSAVGTTVFFGDGTGKLSYMVTTQSDTNRNDFLTTENQAPSYSFRTKEFNFDDSQVWKRLYSWNIDLNMSGSLSPAAPQAGIIIDTNVVPTPATSGFYTNDNTGLIGGIVSTRFRTLTFTYSQDIVGNTSSSYGPTIRGIRAVIGVRTPVNK